MKNQTEQVTSVRLKDIVRSATQPRKIFKKYALEEMATSVKRQGVIEPVIVRPVACIENEEHRKAAGKAPYELVAGERRCRGSELAGKTHVPTIIRKLSDMEALEVQAIENAQRVDLDHLEEGESYDQLLKSGHTTVAELSVSIGKSPATIYARIKTLDAPSKAKEAYRADKLSAPVLLLIARIPNRELAEEATERIFKGRYGAPLTYREIQHMLTSEYMTQLKGSPFDPRDKELVPAAGPCSTCPKRTGNLRETELFADVGRADVCIDSVCFKGKCEAARVRLMVKAESEGKIVLSAEDSRQLYSHGKYLNSDVSVIELEKPCPFAKGKTWQQVVSEAPEGERPNVIVAVDGEGNLRELIGKKEAGEIARALDLATPGETRGELTPEAVQERLRNREARDRHERSIRAVNLAITAVIEKQAKMKDTKALLRLLQFVAVKEANYDTERRVAKRYGFVTQKKDGDVRAYYTELAKKAKAEPLSFILETFLWHNSLFADQGLPEMMTTACKIYGIDTAKIEAASEREPAKADASEELSAAK
jgi:ParB/RepB/Spo0J family partition protein